MSTASGIFSKKERDRIVSAIREAELNTSGEIRVHIENKCNSDDPLKRAAELFNILGMLETEQRNGVIIYLAVKDRKFAIFGDEGIDAVVPDNFWEEIKDKMATSFSKKEFIEGIAYGIKESGDKLKKFFPYQKGDVNELPDQLSFKDE